MQNTAKVLGLAVTRKSKLELLDGIGVTATDVPSERRGVPLLERSKAHGPRARREQNIVTAQRDALTAAVSDLDGARRAVTRLGQHAANAAKMWGF
mgnify:CR=1 FL=1